MDKTTLVEKDIQEGERVVRALDEAGFQVHSALWLYFPEPDEWRLIIASPHVDQHGPKRTYTTIQRVISKISPELTLSLHNIGLASSTDQLIQLLRTAVRTGPGIGRIRFSRNTINGVFIEDAFIYRIQ